MDSKNQLNMGGSGRAFISDLKNGIVDARQEFRLFKQELQDATSIAQRFRDSMSNIKMGGGGGGGGGGGYSPNQIAPDPEFSTPPAQITAGGGGGGGSVVGGGGGGTAMVPASRGGSVVAYTPPITTAASDGGFNQGNNLTNWIKENPAAGSLFAASAASGALFSASETVEAQLLMQRAAFFNSSGRRGRATASGNGPISPYPEGSNDYERIRGLQERMSSAGTVLDSMDSMRALAAAQSYGITGPNVTGGAMGGVAMGVAQASNLLPGIGNEGTMRAFGQMQQARNVNMLRGIGIRLRDEQGNLKPPDQIIDDLWNKICRDYAQAYGSGKKPSEREVLIGLQPGNSMDSMLDMYFGNDPMAKQIIANGLLYKAKSGGGAITKENLTAFGATTDATNAFSSRQATAAEGLGQVANSGARGFELAAQSLTKLGALMNMIDRVTGALQVATGTNAFTTTLLGGGGDFLQKIMMLLLGVKGKATGGPVGGQVPYVVGEEGPELFIPKTDGTIIPNMDGKNPFRHHGGSVKSTGPDMSKNEWAKALITKLGGSPTDANTSAILSWMNQEGGHWSNSAGYNPLNTTREMAGSKLMDAGPGRSHGVRHYTSWEQGLDATVLTLTEKAESRGYDKVVNAIINGKDKNRIMDAVYASKWGTGKGGGTSGGGSSGDVTAESVAEMFGIDPASVDAKTLSQISDLLKDPKYANEVTSLKDFIGGSYASVGGVGGLAGIAGAATASKVFNYGGVAINIIATGAADIKKMLTEILKGEKILESAGKR